MTDHVSYQDITLETVDRAIRDWFDKTVDARVKQPSGTPTKVAVHYAAGERWVESRAKKAFRDKNGVLILPIITLARKGIERDPVMTSLGTETPTITVAKQITQKTNNLMNLYPQRVPTFRGPEKPVVYEVTTIPFPDRVILSYEVQVQTSYTTQMNEILEKIFTQLDVSNSFVAPFENDGKQPQLGVPFELRKKNFGRYVVGFIDTNLTDAGNLDEFTDQERIVRYMMSIRVPTVLQLDPEGNKPAIKTERTSFKLGFGEESVKFAETQEELDKIFGK